MSTVQLIEVDQDSDEQRLDRFLRKHFPDLKQGQIEKLCRKGEFRLDGGRVKAASRVREGQIVRVPPLPKPGENQHHKTVLPVSPADAAMIRACVIYKDDDIIALNKPAGLAVQGGSGQSRHVDGLAEALKYGLEAKPKLVHRLDKDTSGLLILARNGKAAANLAKAFHHRNTRKIYWAAVAGTPSPHQGTIRYGLVKAAGHGPNQAGEKMVCLHPDEVSDTPDAKRATTEYTVLEDLGKRTSWVALMPITGRTHQLRAHMAEIGHPIVGDGKYGGNSQVNDGDGWGSQLGGEVSRKMHLHARTLSFEHPVSKALMRLTAPLPAHMEKTWDLFNWQVKYAPDDPFEDLR